MALVETRRALELRNGFDRIADVLTREREFVDLSAWEFQPLTGGRVSRHVYRLSRNNTTYCLKEIKDNERYTLQLLHRLGLCIAPAIAYPWMLEERVLVCSFIEGEPIQQKKLDQALIRDFAQMQNALNDPELFRSEQTPSGCQYNDHDDGFFRDGMLNHVEEGYRYLMTLKGLGLGMADDFIRVADFVRDHRERLAAAYAEMPFAWQHHDFREANILGDPQRLVDWESSYGHGPFLCDLAPFLVDDPPGSRLYRQGSDICRNGTAGDLDRWLEGALAARFASFLRRRLEFPSAEVSTSDEAESFQGYELRPFNHLLSRFSGEDHF